VYLFKCGYIKGTYTNKKIASNTVLTGCAKMELHRVPGERHFDAFRTLPRQAMNQWCLTPVCSWPVHESTHPKAIKLDGELEYRTNIARVPGSLTTRAAHVKVEVTLK
jgi:hypothetical protein